jgi:ABC-type transporter Mla subunit MlaD
MTITTDDKELSADDMARLGAELRREAFMHRAKMALAGKLDDLSGLKRAAATAEKQLADLKGQIEATQKSADAQAKQVRADADVYAKRATDGAKVTADQIVAAATKRADEANDRTKAAEAKLAETLRQQAEAEAACKASLEKQHTAATEHENYVRKIESAKAEIRRMFDGA